ncbi:cytochrome C [candidate division GN15 bacterium]|uniref:Cytochrome C n=1 Tax=candidate division GN15 bacterium TaxID=2072418 RepID=A0A855X2M8_9BACT|nr:MAG: cytochrome C [candidate division GN15 bacterium]
MAQIFAKWTNKLPTIIAVAVVVGGVGVVAGINYYFSPKFTDVGYRPKQPVPYSHKLHAGDLGMDCRYCHSTIEVSSVANVPPTQTCMNCHKAILPESEKLAPIRESYATKVPMQWVRVHKLPDFVYFNHAAHLRAGVGCISCHGNVAQMEEVMQKQPLSMGWCLECHRNPGPALRPVAEITNMNWVTPTDQARLADSIIAAKEINPPVDCSGCHR